MASITTINGSDVISTSRTDINTNFSNLNTDKIETSTLDTDTTLAANSDSKIATQKAVKAYVDTGGNVNASETVRGIVEEATDAEVTAGTATGATGAKLFVTPAKLSTRLGTTIADSTANTTAKQYTVGALDNSSVKTYFNMQLPFILWTGAVANDTTTTFVNWIRGSDDTSLMKGGIMADFTSTGDAYLFLSDFWALTPGNIIAFDDANTIILDWWAYLPNTSTGTIQMGFATTAGNLQADYNSSANSRVTFAQSGAGVLYATISKGGTGVSTTDISSGIDTTAWNNYRIEFDLGTNVKFYINGVLKATLSGANLDTSTSTIGIGFGRDNNANFAVTAPNLSFQMNP